MLERYSRKVMHDIWTEESKFNAYLKVEIKASEAFNKLKIVPDKDLKKIIENASFDIIKIKEIEQETNHDVVAFTRAVSLSLGDERKWIHYGLTSTDVVDTANGVLLKQANDILLDDLCKIQITIKEKALRYKNTPCIGRTHGMHADVTSFGLKWVLWYEQITRSIKRFKDVRLEVECGKISGAVGNYANISPFVQEYVCESLGLVSANISTQVLQRDRHANYMSVLALIGSILEQIATEIRSLQRSEIFEVEEYFKKGQKGSSAMPHKRNPISSENICGCARVLRGYMLTFYENVSLWHERDISHSSTERIILPDATCLLDYMLNRLNNVLANLVVYEDNMLKNIYKTNKVIFAQRVMNELINNNLSRESAYDLIQPIAIRALDNNLDYQELLLSNQDVLKILSVDEINDCFNLDYYFKNVGYIYDKVKVN